MEKGLTKGGDLSSGKKKRVFLGETFSEQGGWGGGGEGGRITLVNGLGQGPKGPAKRVGGGGN